MPDVSYVYPNLSKVYLKSDTPRGGLTERWELGKILGCKYIEVPGTLIKNKTEERLLGKTIGQFLDEKDIQQLYSKGADLPKELRYILHTEPSLGKADQYGQKISSPINWYDREWRINHLEMIKLISIQLGKPADFIEIHPGYQRNKYEDIAVAILEIIDGYKKAFDVEPLIMLENRTEQFISKGRDIRDFWVYLESEHPELISKSGIILDVQQLFTSTKSSFFKELSLIPPQCLRGFHIHAEHRAPMLNDRIDWKIVFGIIKELDGRIVINPEIHQKDKVKYSIDFCERLLSK
ncbi:hypothetical protein KEJ47_06200 [Candidatus Bathyarchaeota archaeon]|nr:hypothetical protein [Candidatus Bathyarchaeota archaeon]